MTQPVVVTISLMLLCGCERPVDTIEDVPALSSGWLGDSRGPMFRRDESRDPFSDPSLDWAPFEQLDDAVQTTYGVPIVGVEVRSIGASTAPIDIWHLPPNGYIQTEPPFGTVYLDGTRPGGALRYRNHYGEDVRVSSIDGQTYIGYMRLPDGSEVPRPRSVTDTPPVDTLSGGRVRLRAPFAVFEASCDAASGQCTFDRRTEMSRRWSFTDNGYLRSLPSFYRVRSLFDSALATRDLRRDAGADGWRFPTRRAAQPVAAYVHDQPARDGQGVDRTVVAFAYVRSTSRTTRAPVPTSAYALVVLGRGTVAASDAETRPPFHARPGAEPATRPAESPREAFERARDRVTEENRAR